MLFSSKYIFFQTVICSCLEVFQVLPFIFWNIFYRTFWMSLVAIEEYHRSCLLNKLGLFMSNDVNSYFSFTPGQNCSDFINWYLWCNIFDCSCREVPEGCNRLLCSYFTWVLQFRSKVIIKVIFLLVLSVWLMPTVIVYIPQWHMSWNTFIYIQRILLTILNLALFHPATCNSDFQI